MPRTPRRLALGLAAAALAVTPAAAQRVRPVDDGAYARAIAAGYKALTYCNGIFAAGRTPAQIDAEELRGIYPEYDAIVPMLTSTVDHFEGSVEVDWSPTLPPRRAEYRPDSGCGLDPIVTTPRGHIYPIGPDMPVLARLPADPRPWPMGDGRIAPRPSRAIADAINGAFARGYGAGVRTIGVIVLRDGRVVAERYAAGWGPFVANRTWSAAKSMSGTLVGLAVAAGKADPAKLASVPEWAGEGDPRSAITLDNLLRMASGLQSGAGGNRTDAIYFGDTAVTQEAYDLPLKAAPGMRFRYANDDVLMAVRSLRTTLGERTYDDSPATVLFRPLGMSHTQAGKDLYGNYILSSQVWSTARDLARLGQFWLQDGVWQGKRLLPAGWMRYMTTPSGPQPADGPGYGATMWLFGPKQGLPAGSYAAQGNRGQYVMVIPSAQLVIVRRGEDPGAARFDIARFSADVLAAVKGDHPSSPRP